jgi:hypothetical protein
MQYLLIIIGIAVIEFAAAISLAGETVTHRLHVPQVITEPTATIANPLDETNSPIIAFWQDDPGTWRMDTNYPYLRVAVWADGRVVFARDSNIWNQDLLIGQLSAQTLATLEEDIRRTGVFELKGFCYLGPEFAVDCVMLSLGGSQQMLYWNEVENKLSGITTRSLTTSSSKRHGGRLTDSSFPPCHVKLRSWRLASTHPKNGI